VRNPSIATLVKLADALGVGADYLLGFGEAAKPQGRQHDALLKDVAKLSARDLELIAEMAKFLANRDQ